MLDNTKSFFIVLLDDIKRLLKTFEILSLLITLIYAVAAIFLDVGNFWINIVIVIVASIYGIVNLIIKSPQIGKVYKALKLIISAISLTISIYGIYASTVSTNGITIIISTLMVIFWILQFLTLIMQLVLNRHIQMLKVCALEDMRPLLKLQRATNAFRGKEDTYEELDEASLAKLNELHRKSELIKEKKNKEDISNKKKNTKTIIEDAKKEAELIDLSTFIKKSITKCAVDKVVSLKPFLAENSNHKIANRLLSFGLVKDVSENELRITAGSLILKELPKINYDKLSLASFVRNQKIDYQELLKNNDQMIDLLILAEKIIYIYGFPEIRPNYQLTDNTLKALILALEIIALEDTSKYHDLYELAKLDANALNKTKRLANNIKDGFSNLKEQMLSNNDKKGE